MTKKNPELHRFPTPCRGGLCGVGLTVQSLLESVHRHHVLCELEGLAVCLDGELSINKETPVSSAKKTQYHHSLAFMHEGSAHPVSFSSFS